jgi:membrane protein implicated in regulation of membrane protease activity
MKTFGWVCFWLGLAILAIGLPAVLIFSMTPVLIGKVLIASGINLSIGWSLAHPKKKYMQKYCTNCGTLIENDKFCINCGLQLRSMR